ncbi:hypothetical protein [Gulosibacter sp. 10]|uniref:hypothetical protein n=1 Tax=Gulosibacter sp. 10 TaxID=1255570 RepID=UPI001122DF67|nr:hypothetical protein [Gulosibacter sp. 10]
MRKESTRSGASAAIRPQPARWRLFSTDIGWSDTEYATPPYRARMRSPTPLPQALRKAGFTCAEARQLGVSRSRLDAGDLHRPYHGVRTVFRPKSDEERAYALGLALPEGHAVSGLLAAKLWGLPLPAGYRERQVDLEVLTTYEGSKIELEGVRTRRIRPDCFQRLELRGIPVVSPMLALVTASRYLDLEWTTVLADALLTDSDRYNGLCFAVRPYLRLDLVDAFLKAFSRIAGMPKVRSAFERARGGVESPMETITRIRLVDAGLPEPVVQHEVVLCDGTVARPDLGYPHANSYIDYEGDHHSSDRRTFERDLHRARLFERSGLHLIRLTGRDLHGERFAHVLELLRGRLFPQR